MLARDVMTTPVISVTPATRTRDAVELMLAHHLSGLPVLDENGKLIGILSEGDLIRRSELGTEKHRSRFIAFILGPGRAAHDYTKSHSRFVRGVMTQEVIAVAEETPIEEIVGLMEKHGIKRMPVMRASDIIGMVSRSDLLRALVAASRKREETMNDAAIKARILDEIAKEEWAPQNSVAVGVKDGAVVLTGTIFDARQRLALKVVVENTPGVKTVQDRLVWIEPGSGLVVEAPDEAEDGDLAR
ncbi:MAG: CBS domain-containing protein [Hyphomicrobiales bacterium]|nr:CBS domain-containing protein [Hyphomicrobiales bacterium]MBV9521130.1 CBS domain-containing protein [Hyphomicrobiales bacterium]